MGKNKQLPDMNKHRKKLRKSCIERWLFFSFLLCIGWVMIAARSYQMTATGADINLITVCISLLIQDETYPVVFWPLQWNTIWLFFLGSAILAVLQWQRYLNYKDTMTGIEEGTGGFNEDIEGFRLTYSYPPRAFTRKAGLSAFFGTIFGFPKRLFAKIRLLVTKGLHKVFPTMNIKLLKAVSFLAALFCFVPVIAIVAVTVVSLMKF